MNGWMDFEWTTLIHQWDFNTSFSFDFFYLLSSFWRFQFFWISMGHY